jgi:hypothetical protein
LVKENDNLHFYKSWQSKQNKVIGKLGKSDMIPIKYDDEEGLGYVAKAIIDDGDEQKNWNNELMNYVDGFTHTSF